MVAPLSADDFWGFVEQLGRLLMEFAQRQRAERPLMDELKAAGWSVKPIQKVR